MNPNDAFKKEVKKEITVRATKAYCWKCKKATDNYIKVVDREGTKTPYCVPCFLSSDLPFHAIEV